MPSPVNSPGGYQAYAYQQGTSPVVPDPRGGENRIQQSRQEPAGDSQRADPRERNSGNETRSERAPERPADSLRGNNLDESA